MSNPMHAYASQALWYPAELELALPAAAGRKILTAEILILFAGAILFAGPARSLPYLQIASRLATMANNIISYHIGNQ